MRCSSFRIFLVSCAFALISLPVVADNLSTSDIAWLAGYWEGIGDDGETQGKFISLSQFSRRRMTGLSTVAYITEGTLKHSRMHPGPFALSRPMRQERHSFASQIAERQA